MPKEELTVVFVLILKLEQICPALVVRIRISEGKLHVLYKFVECKIELEDQLLIVIETQRLHRVRQPVPFGCLTRLGANTIHRTIQVMTFRLHSRESTMA